MTPQCLITGADLVQADGNVTVHGDLHKVGSTYVFNAVRTPQGDANWRRSLPQTNRVIYVQAKDYFERRGVIVFSADDAILSTHAASYINKE